MGQVPARTVWEKKKKPTQSEVGRGMENPPHTCPVAIPTPRVGVEEGVVDYCLFLPMSDYFWNLTDNETFGSYP